MAKLQTSLKYENFRFIQINGVKLPTISCNVSTYLLADDSVPAAACEHLYPEQETPVPHGAAAAPAGRAQLRVMAEERISFYGFLSGLARGHLQ